ncbi:hypothetical protein [Janthinobacterium sp. BJB301]|uniref:hypothetical protein n=1 Tax=Janthinobacterium sp. BJB301 TaxID=1560195 RepID=UPI00117B295D|nr:hypothetical protein [Janthinobacterium sp. BJB301]
MNNLSPPKQFIIPGNLRQVAFYDLLADAVFQHRYAISAKDNYTQSRFARASILASSLCVECVANCLFDSLNASKNKQAEFGKLPIIFKYSTYFHVKNVKGFDKNRVEVLRIDDLARARNDHVHPKTQSLPVRMATPEDGGADWIFPMTLDCDLWENILIPKRSMLWSGENSLTVLKAISEFFKYIFVSLHDFTEEELHAIFMPRVETANIMMPVLFDEIRSELERIDIEGVDFSYFWFFPESDKA